MLADTPNSFANVSHQPMLKPMAMAALWRHRTVKALRQWQQFLDEQGLLSAAISEQLAYAMTQLTREHYTIAVVAEVSRGKSELINAMLFAQHGQRVVPSGAGRTTMCPTEFFCDQDVAPYLELLPIETRADPTPFAQLSQNPSAWKRFDLDGGNTQMLQQALQKVCAKQMVSLEQAQALGFEIDSFDHIEENALLVASGSVGTMVEVPLWRYARLNIHHPLLATGLAILDTPGLNVLGHEPELTHAILPTVDSVIYLLSADIGASRSDQLNWQTHLGHLIADNKLAVLNKIDALNDGLRSTLDVSVDIVRQMEQCAQALELPKAQVFAISAQQALLSRIRHDDALLAQSRLPDLERSMSSQLLERRQDQLKNYALRALELSQQTAMQSLQSLSVQTQTQIDELSGLSISKDPQHMIASYTEETKKRVALESALSSAVHQTMKQHWAVVKNALSSQLIFPLFEDLIAQANTASTGALKKQLNTTILAVHHQLETAILESQKAKVDGQKTLAKIKQLNQTQPTQSATGQSATGQSTTSQGSNTLADKPSEAAANKTAVNNSLRKITSSALEFPIAFDDASIEASLQTVQQELSRMAQTSSTYLPALPFLSATHRVKATQTFLAIQQRCEQLMIQAKTDLTHWFEGMNQTLQNALNVHRSLLNKRNDTLERMHQAQQALSQNLSSQTAALDIFSAQKNNLDARYQNTLNAILSDAPHTSLSASNAQNSSVHSLNNYSNPTLVSPQPGNAASNAAPTTTLSAAPTITPTAASKIIQTPIAPAVLPQVTYTIDPVEPLTEAVFIDS